MLFFSISTFSQKANTLKVGDHIPRFFLEDQNGNFFDSDDFLGKQALVIFFYPKAGAPVCTAEACLFRDNTSDFKQLNAKIIGISPDDTENQQNFTEEYNLPYQVLSDKNNRVRKLFGVPTLFLSKRPKRYTFIIDKNGIIQKIYYNKKNVNAHVEESLITLYRENINEFTIKK
ncbi:MAG TPA: peroxiredoxin [Flavobacteriia bacterium]|nr:peroxiredoxin [Flavobacteriia bacterium]